MSEEDIRKIYRKGEEAMIAFVMDLLKQLNTVNAQDKKPLIDPATPSAMRPVYSKPSRKGKKKKPGRKKGHPGSRRQQPLHIDKCKEHTLEVCPDCSGSLPGSYTTRTRYTEEIVPSPPEVTEHIIHRYWCSTCEKTVEPTLTDALPKSTIGLNTLVLTCWMHYAQGITLEKVLQILNQAFQMKVTKGGLVQAWQKLAQILHSVYDDIGHQAHKSAVLHVDETGWRVSGLTYWLWCFTNHRLVYFVIDRSRGSPVVKKVLGSLFSGILISDFYSAYNSLVAMAKQKCFSHIFTDMARTDIRTQSVEWKSFRKKLSRFLKDAIKVHKHIKERGEDEWAQQKQKLHQRLRDIYSQPYTDREAKRLARRLEKHQDEILTFLDHPEISHDNNHAERQLRPAVISRKNSYCNRSDNGALNQAVFMTIFRTMYLRNQDPVASIINIIKNYMINEDVSTWESLCTTNG
jgi:transposase